MVIVDNEKKLSSYFVLKTQRIKIDVNPFVTKFVPVPTLTKNIGPPTVVKVTFDFPSLLDLRNTRMRR